MNNNTYRFNQSTPYYVFIKINMRKHPVFAGVFYLHKFFILFKSKTEKTNLYKFG